MYYPPWVLLSCPVFVRLCAIVRKEAQSIIRDMVESVSVVLLKVFSLVCQALVRGALSNVGNPKAQDRGPSPCGKQRAASILFLRALRPKSEIRNQMKKGGSCHVETRSTLCLLQPHYPGEHRLQDRPKLGQVQGCLRLSGPEEELRTQSHLGLLAALLTMVDCSMLTEAYT
jgi:hypothetical protein